MPIRSVVSYMTCVQSCVQKPVAQDRKNLVLGDQLKEERKEQNYDSKKEKKPKTNHFAHLIGGGGKDVEKGGIDEVVVDRPTFKEGEDPINYLGFGIASYFQMIRTFMVMFLIMTLLNIPIMALYVKSGAYNDQPIAKSPVKISLGALGFS